MRGPQHVPMAAAFAGRMGVYTGAVVEASASVWELIRTAAAGASLDAPLSPRLDLLCIVGARSVRPWRSARPQPWGLSRGFSSPRPPSDEAKAICTGLQLQEELDDARRRRRELIGGKCLVMHTPTDLTSTTILSENRAYHPGSLAIDLEDKCGMSVRGVCSVVGCGVVCR